MACGRLFLRTGVPTQRTNRKDRTAMKLQKATICGLYAVLELAARHDEQISAGEIARKYDISLNHLAKVLRTLVRAKLIESVRGPGGGYRFCGNPKRVTLLDIIELFEDPSPDLAQDSAGDNDESRALHRVLTDIDDIAVMTLRSVSITSLLKIIETDKRKGDRASRAARAAVAG
jgi:Rrf2 family transcriptional regulator, iron-sulfur cluster assembly transcription factor